VRDMLPFRLGNIHRAYEDYSYSQYGLHGIFFWPRLAKVIPADYADKIVEQNNHITFLLNSSLISALIGIEILVWLIILRIKSGVLDWRAIVALFCGAISYVFYYGATSVALTHGRYIRTCYDFFRLELLKELHIDPPPRLGGEDEKALWRSVHEFLVLGQGSPYQLQAPTFSSSRLISTAVELIHLWIKLIFWTGLKRVSERLLTSAGTSRVKTPVVDT
jgi:hypothetical protein